MHSFRTEIENPIVEKDIIELADKIELFHKGKIDEEKFRSLRLARGVYGQRQEGVQMIRIKLPYGKVLSNQLRRISDVSDEYSRGRLHITTRQDIQIHYVSLDRTPELWAQLERDDVTLREACGNTVRNVTASETAGIDINEPFDVSPYADALFKFFLRNPICQEMGRKFKVSFSASDDDTGLSYMHDLGFIAKIENDVRGFKVMLGGGLGSQPRHADEFYSFLPSNKIIPLMEGVLRIFDRYGERKSRAKARMKFLIKDIGLEAFKTLVEEEQNAIEFKSVNIDADAYSKTIPVQVETPKVEIENQYAFELWKSTNVIPQKQAGYVAIGIKVLLGDFYTDKARLLADLVENYAAGEVRLSLRQNILIPFVKEELVPFFYTELGKLDFVEAGYNKAIDITACPGTDTCNLGIASSTGIAVELERVIKNEYPQYLQNKDLVIKISGCMNACGQHMAANIGFHGSSIKRDGKVLPAMQIVLGGGVDPDGKGYIAEKVIKLPTKRIPDALRILLDEYEQEDHGLYFNDFVRQHGKRHFYDRLKELANTENLTDRDFVDWGNEGAYQRAIGVGECAGVSLDLVSIILQDAAEKLDLSGQAYQGAAIGDSIYHSYSAFVIGAKALLLHEDIRCNTHKGIIKDFQEHFVATGKIAVEGSFPDLVLQINQNEPSPAFATAYGRQAQEFVQRVFAYRQQHGGETDKLVIGNYYKA